jgi:L-fuconolactonase
MIVDSHCHVSSRWYEPAEALLFQMDRHGVDRAVLIPLLGSLDNSDMIAAVRAHPDRLAFVAAVDPTGPAAQVGAVQEQGARGLRLRAAWRGSEDAPLEIWREAEARGMAISVVGPAASLVDGRLGEVAAACPNLPLVLEHLGGLARPDVGDRAEALPRICALSAHPNVFLKFPGLGQLAPRLERVEGGDPPLNLAGLDALIAAVVEAFGAKRLMWGSDYPPVSSREGYGHALAWPRERFSPQDAEHVFGQTAATVFRLKTV